LKSTQALKNDDRERERAFCQIVKSITKKIKKCLNILRQDLEKEDGIK
jgi:hypothetical protein